MVYVKSRSHAVCRTPALGAVTLGPISMRCSASVHDLKLKLESLVARGALHCPAARLRLIWIEPLAGNTGAASADPADPGGGGGGGGGVRHPDLNDHKTLGAYKIPDGATLWLVVQVRGRARASSSTARDSSALSNARREIHKPDRAPNDRGNPNPPPPRR